MRALTREVGTLKEDVRREVKRRERATINVREAEELRQEAEKRVKQLEYSKRYAWLPCQLASFYSSSLVLCDWIL